MKKSKMLCLVIMMIMTLGLTTVSTAANVQAATKKTVKVTNAKKAAKKAKKTVKKGNTFTSGKFKYKVTSVKGKTGTVTLTGTTSKSLTTATIPKTVKLNGYTLTVNVIGSSAFKNCKKLETVTTNNAIKTIGSSAFSGCEKLETINIKSTKLSSVGDNALKGISEAAVINAPESKYSAYSNLLEDKGQDPEVAISHTHSYGSWKVTKEATCTAAGTMSATCTGCGATTTKSIAALGHDYSLETEDAEGNVYKSCSHDGCSARIFVSSKKTEEQPSRNEPAAEQKKPDQPAAADKNADPQETVKQPAAAEPPVSGKEESKEPESQPTETPKATPKETPKATPKATPKPTATPKHDHTYKSVTEPATCTTAGQTFKICTSCRATTASQKIPALGHNWSDWKKSGTATCQQTVKETRTCDRCGKTETRSTAKGDHKFDKCIMNVTPTCTVAGSYYEVCSICGTRGKLVNMPGSGGGHQWTEWQTEVPAGCTTDGRDVRSCTKCGTVEARKSQQATGHNMELINTVSEKTCGRASATTYTYRCSNCGMTKTERDDPGCHLIRCKDPNCKKHHIVYCEIHESHTCEF